jgi:hypothetical protein
VNVQTLLKTAAPGPAAGIGSASSVGGGRSPTTSPSAVLDDPRDVKLLDLARKNRKLTIELQKEQVQVQRLSAALQVC